MNTTGLAESVLRRLGVETIGGKVFLPLQKEEVIAGRYQVDEPFLCTDRAIALECLGHVNSNPEANAAAMAASLVPGSLWLRHVFDPFEGPGDVIGGHRSRYTCNSSIREPSGSTQVATSAMRW